MSDEREAGPNWVAAYKILLRDVLDRRPSGTRQRLATALGKNRSFVSQITNPAYPVPIPAQHLAAIFEVCHLAPAERQKFLDAYERAHPGRLGGLEEGLMRSVVVRLPDLGDPARNAALDSLVQDFAARLGRFAEGAD